MAGGKGSKQGSKGEAIEEVKDHREVITNYLPKQKANEQTNKSGKKKGKEIGETKVK